MGVQEELDELKQRKGNYEADTACGRYYARGFVYGILCGIEDEEIVGDREIEIPGMEEETELRKVTEQLFIRI